MKKRIFVIISVVVLGLIFYYFKNIYGWMEFRKNTDTPDQFLNKTVTTKEDYTKDSFKILSELKDLLLRHEAFFIAKNILRELT